jgi:hypothetical protein
MSDERHIAVVPISSVDHHATDALAYARTVASEVIAVSTDKHLEALWRESGPTLPLVIVEATDGDRAAAIQRAVAVLKRSEQPAQVSLVVPLGYSW